MSEDSSAQDALLGNRAEFAAQEIETIAFGAYLVIATMSLYLLYQRKGSTRSHSVTVMFTWFMLVVTTAWYYCETRVAEVELVESPATNSNDLTILNYCSPTNIAANVLSTLQFFCSDALLVYRTLMLYHRHHWAWMLLPCVMYLSYFGVGIATNLACRSKEFGGTLPLAPLESLAMIFYSLTAAMSIVLTGMICLKLLRHNRQLSSIQPQLSQRCGTKVTYVSIVGILVESAAVYSAACFIFVILTATNSPAQSWFGGVISAASFLCQSWIVLRVSMGYSDFDAKNLDATSGSTGQGSSTLTSPRRGTFLYSNSSRAGAEADANLQSSDFWEDRKLDNAYPMVPTQNVGY